MDLRQLWNRQPRPRRKKGDMGGALTKEGSPPSDPVADARAWATRYLIKESVRSMKREHPEELAAIGRTYLIAQLRELAKPEELVVMQGVLENGAFAEQLQELYLWEKELEIAEREAALRQKQARPRARGAFSVKELEQAIRRRPATQRHHDDLMLLANAFAPVVGALTLQASGAPLEVITSAVHAMAETAAPKRPRTKQQKHGTAESAVTAPAKSMLEPTALDPDACVAAVTGAPGSGRAAGGTGQGGDHEHHAQT